MFCPNCGEKLEAPNQRFCARCGSEIQITLPLEVPVTLETSQEPQLVAEESQVISPVPSVPAYQSKFIKTEGPGPHSKMCFGFSLVAIAFFIAGLIFGGNIILRVFIPVYFIPYLPGGPIMWIIAFFLHIVGFVFGILSRVNSSKAGKCEVDNALEKVGSVFGVFGILLNVIPLIIIPVMIVVAPVFYYDPYIF